jgi:hypothetical protein
MSMMEDSDILTLGWGCEAPSLTAGSLWGGSHHHGGGGGPEEFVTLEESSTHVPAYLYTSSCRPHCLPFSLSLSHSLSLSFYLFPLSFLASSSLFFVYVCAE